MVVKIKLNQRRHLKEANAQFYEIQVFHPKGYYPSGLFLTDKGFFYADEDIAFSAVVEKPWTIEEGLPYSEVDWMGRELVRLLGSFIITDSFSYGGKSLFYPILNACFQAVPEVKKSYSSKELAESIKSSLLNYFKKHADNFHQVNKVKKCINTRYNLYTLNGEELVYQKIGWKSIDPEVHLMTRGFQAIVKSDMLSTYPEFIEEAALAIFISLDASFELVRRELKQNGIQSPTSQDAGDWLYENFEKNLGFEKVIGLKYFEDFYSQRVQTVHPGSRYGDSPYAVLSVDDLYHLRNSLPSLYGFLAIGKHSPSFVREVDERVIKK